MTKLKRRLKLQLLNLKNHISHTNWRLGITATAMVAGLVLSPVPVALATNYDAQINALQNQINQNRSAANQKSAEADTLQAKVSQLQAQLNAAQAALDLTRTQIAKTEADIAVNEAELAKQQNNLRDSLRAMYKDRDVTPIEVLASSDNLSDFVGKQQYMQQLKDKVEATIADIKTITAQLQQQRSDLTAKADSEKAQANSIASLKAEQQNLLAQTRGQEAAYQNLVKQNQSQLNAVYAARAAEIARNRASGGSYSGGAPCGGGYPGYLCNARQDSLVDPWGYYNRECVSYAAWKRSSIGRMVPMYWGNAGDWYSRASSSSPAYGDVAVWGYGPGYPYGHVAIVEAVNGGMMTVSEYNYGGPGVYSVRTIPVNYNGVRFIK